MVKTFTTDKDGYVKFTEKELKALLDEVYREGQKSGKLITWSSPYDYYGWCYNSNHSLNDISSKSTITCSNGSNAITTTSSNGQLSITI